LSADGSLTVSIPASRDRHDAILRERVAPLVRELGTSPNIAATYFERINKPAWEIRVHVFGERSWLDGEGRSLVESRAREWEEGAALVPDDPEDKWVGGLRVQEHLKGIYHLDTVACLDLMDVETEGDLGTSRAQWSLLLVEELLGLFGLRGTDRLEFYRRGYQWALDLRRWGDDVLDVLDEKFDAQKAALAATLDPEGGGPSEDAWGGPRAARIASRLLASAREPISAILASAAAGTLERETADLATFVAHAHSNRLGVHATQEATIRYLVWRARGGARPTVT
jgi:thiopeptide-type bacteriocin biosynthesis protein